jgi:hypothetical protein
VYFWRSLQQGFEELHRVLAPGGRAVVGSLPKPWMDRLGHPADIFASRTTAEVTDAMHRCGFRALQVERPGASTRWNVVVARR